MKKRTISMLRCDVMKKRIIGFMLVVCIVIPCVSYPAKAEDSDIDGVAAAMLDILPIKENSQITVFNWTTYNIITFFFEKS